ncbi:hypothetical protein NL676_029118 [Syzygium grande]|nr:hypothetical protein NL676_029118 [Syzygium grande]
MSLRKSETSLPISAFLKLPCNSHGAPLVRGSPACLHWPLQCDLVCVQGGLSDAVLQKTLDYACGAGADCGPTKQNGACYAPNTVRAHCSYAVNSFFQKKGQAQGTCDFAGTAAISTSDPSASGCVYPSSASASSTTTTPVTTTPSTATPSTTTPTTTTGTPTTTATPYTATPTGVVGGVTGMSPTGINTDVSGAGFRRLSSSCWVKRVETVEPVKIKRIPSLRTKICQTFLLSLGFLVLPFLYYSVEEGKKKKKEKGRPWIPGKWWAAHVIPVSVRSLGLEDLAVPLFLSYM